jgi:aminoglycoside 6'-N-acetyltransferase-1b
VLDPSSTFREVFRSNLWGADSRSGAGSGADQTSRIAAAIPALCRRLGVRRLLDIPCGDFSWMANVDLGGTSYVGADIVPDLLERNRALHARADREFLQLDLTKSPLPQADLILCRDCLVHLSNADVEAALANIVRSHIPWLLTTTFPGEPANVDIVTGDWRPIDLTKPPFNLPVPEELINEGCTEQGGAFADKSLGLWRVSALDERLERAGDVTLRLMTEHDIPMLHAWLNQPHIVEWWGRERPTLEAVRERYLPRVLAQERVTPYVGLLGGRPFAYAQSYVALGAGGGWWEDETDPGVRGIDQSIGYPELLGRGLGTKLVRALVSVLFNDPTVTRIQTDPAPSNARAIRCYEKAGFRKVKTIVTPDGPAIYMVRDRLTTDE